MLRAIIAVIVGIVVWGLCAQGLDMLLRSWLPGYTAAEPTLTFTMAMMLARLALPGAVPSVCAGFACAWTGRSDRRVVAALATLLVAVFAPVHYHLWDRLPVWYHLTFLSSLVVLTFAGAALAPRHKPA
jgi:hypothetical protein